ncbi:unnamed protein product [Effrenium voratum]|nr:unnamed protein product [Effrenium voratum]
MALGDTLKPAEAVKLPKPATSAQIIKAISGDSSTISADYAADWVQFTLSAGKKPGASAWSSVIQAYLNEDRPDDARQWLEWMQQNGTAPSYDVYLKFMRSDDRKAASWHDQMEDAGIPPTAESFNLVIKSFSFVKGKQRMQKTEEWFHRMRAAGVAPDEETFAHLIAAAARSGKPEDVDKWQAELTESGLRPDNRVYFALMQRYLVERDPLGVRQILDWMVLKGNRPHRAAYNLAIRAFAEAGDMKSAEEIYRRLEAVGGRRDERTFYFLIRGHVYQKSPKSMERARAWLKEMLQMDVRPSFSIYGALIQGYAQLQQPKEAKEFLEELSLRKSWGPDRQAWLDVLRPALRCFQKAGDEEAVAKWTDFLNDKGVEINLEEEAEAEVSDDSTQKRPQNATVSRKFKKGQVSSVEREMKTLQEIQDAGNKPEIRDFNRVMKAFALSPRSRYSMARAFIEDNLMPVVEADASGFGVLIGAVSNLLMDTIYEFGLLHCELELLPLLPLAAAGAVALWGRGRPGVRVTNEVGFPLLGACPSQGSTEGPILLAAEGLVFDVSSSRSLYGPDGKYAPLAGRDASRLLGKNSLDEETEESKKMPLNMAERAFLSAWVLTFKSKYPIVGELKEEDQETAEPAALLGASEKGDLQRLNAQLAQGADLSWADGDGLQALHWAARSGHAAAVSKLLSAGADASGRDQKGRTALHWAATFGHTEAVEALLPAIPAEAEAADAWLPLHFAAQNGHLETMKALIRNGADINRASKAGVTALMNAARSGQREVVKLLLEKGADTGAKVNGKTAQQWAESQGLNQIAEMISSVIDYEKDDVGCARCNRVGDGKRGIFTIEWMSSLGVTVRRTHIEVAIRQLFDDYKAEKIDSVQLLLEKLLQALPEKSHLVTYNSIIRISAEAGLMEISMDWAKRMRSENFWVQPNTCYAVAKAHFKKGDEVSSLWWIDQAKEGDRGATAQSRLSRFVETVTRDDRSRGFCSLWRDQEDCYQFDAISDVCCTESTCQYAGVWQHAWQHWAWESTAQEKGGLLEFRGLLSTACKQLLRSLLRQKEIVARACCSWQRGL